MKKHCRWMPLALLAFSILAAASDELATQIKNPDVKLRQEAAERLGKTGNKSAVPVLADALRDPSEKVRRKVIIALDRLRYPETLEPLRQATQDPAPELARLAILSLVNHSTGRELNLGVTGRLKTLGSKVKRGFEMDDARIDSDVLVDPLTIKALENVLKRKRGWEAERAAAWGLGILMARPAVGTLVDTAHSPDPDLAREAMNSLTKIRDPSAGPPLVDLLDSPYEDVRKDAAVTVGVLRTREAVEPLGDLYRRARSRKVRAKALEGLAFIGDETSVTLFEEALKSRNAEFRIAAAEGFAHVGDAQYADELRHAMANEKGGKARLAMAFALAAMGDFDYVLDLVQQLGSAFRRNFARAYLIELSHDPDARFELYQHLNYHAPDVRKNLCQILMYYGDSDTIQALEHLTRDENNDVAIEAIRATRVIRAREIAKGRTPQGGKSKSNGDF